jgi:hypothetical protein
MTYLCTGSRTTKAANRRPAPDPSLPHLEQVNWRYTSGVCMDCGHRFDFADDPNRHKTSLVLPAHLTDGTLKEPPQ